MQLEQQNILFFTRTMEVGGTEQIVLQLCRIFQDKVNKIVVCSGGGSYTAKLEEMHIRHYTLPDITKRTPRMIYKTYIALKKIIEEEEITVVHTHHRMAAFYVRILQRRYHYIHIVTVHNIFKNRRLMTRMAYKGANIIACGNAVKDNLKQFFGVPENGIHVIYNSVEEYKMTDGKESSGTDEGDIYEKVQKWKEKGYFLVGNIARLEKQKGIAYFIRSFPIARKRCNKLKYIIIGDGSEREALESLAMQMGGTASENDIIFLGRRDDVSNLMSCMDLIVLSSLWEGRPLVPIEAFAAGKTIVASNIEGVNEIVTDQRNGILVPPADAIALAEGITRLLTDQDKRKRLEENAYHTYCEEYSYAAFVRQTLDYYCGL
ncbi:MAG: glycosyltransferase family 4 protein [Lachnospiraceae bacterium]|nr:glycosyltransferase family 4 protein [Lachnospiraceae bacterium]